MIESPIYIRLYKTDDASALTDIFYDAIHSVADEYYSEAQVNAWAPLPKDYKKWAKRFDDKPPFVAEIDHCIVGFMSLEGSGYIDWAFTHNKYHRVGVASALYVYLESQAKHLNIDRLFVKASYHARPFFEKKGFSVTEENSFERHGQILVNWSMEKYLVS